MHISGNLSISHSILTKPKQSRCSTISPNRIINNKLSTTNVLYNNCDCSECPTTTATKLKSNNIVSKFKSNDFSCLTMAPIVCVNLPETKKCYSPTKLINQNDEISISSTEQIENTLYCKELASKMTLLPFSKSTTDVRTVSNENNEDNCNNSNKMMAKQSSVDHHVENKLNIEPGMVSLSKSETNIFDDKTNGGILSVFNVVSLNGLNDATNSFCNKPMNDLSKNQILNISDNEIERNFFENENN